MHSFRRTLAIVVGLVAACLPADSFLGCNAFTEFALSGTSLNMVLPAGHFCHPFPICDPETICICKIFITSASAGSPVANSFRVATDSGAGDCSTPTDLWNAAGVTGADADFGGALRGAPGAPLCASEAVANGDKLTVTYAYIVF